MEVVQKTSDYLFNHIAKCCARDVYDARHDYGDFKRKEIQSNVPDSWRIPVIDTHRKPNEVDSFYFNDVTFIYPFDFNNAPQSISIIGTFYKLHEPVPLQVLNDSRYYTLTYKIPKGEVHYYKYMVDGQPLPDPINPQRQVLENGEEWSRFFTDNCNVPVSFERWERVLLERLTDHILPFRTEDAARFLNNYYHFLDKNSKETLFSRAHLLDQSVGVVNYIDKIVAREEYHRLSDYKTCLAIIDKVLRQRNPYTEPEEMSREIFVDIYNQMASGNVPGWDYNKYNNPNFFLRLLRRHTISGAFSHPKYGGNAECAGWEFLSNRYRNGDGQTLFNWKLSLEKPIGACDEYNG